MCGRITLVNLTWPELMDWLTLSENRRSYTTSRDMTFLDCGNPWKSESVEAQTSA